MEPPQVEPPQMAIQDLDGMDYDAVMKSTKPSHPSEKPPLGSSETCSTSEKPQNVYILEKSLQEEPPLPTSAVPEPPPHNLTRFLTWKNVFAAAVFVLFAVIIIYTNVSSEKKFRQQNERIAALEHALNVSCKVCSAGGASNEDRSNLSKLENLTTEFNNRIERIEASLQAHVSSTDSILQDYREEISGRFTQLEDSVNTRLLNSAAETRRNMAAFADSLTNLSRQYSQLEADTRNDLNFINSSLHEENRLLSERLSVIRAEVHNLINRSTAEVFEHIENEITEVGEHIRTQVADLRGHVDTQVSGVREHVDSQVSGVRAYVDSQNSDVREDIRAQVSELRGDVNTQVSEVGRQAESQVAGLREHVDSQDSETRRGIATEVRRQIDNNIRYINTRIDSINDELRQLRSGAIGLRNGGPLLLLVVSLSALT